MEDEADFNVPIAKYYKLIKRSPNDFDIIQIVKVKQLPLIPKYVFDKKSKDKGPVIVPDDTSDNPIHEEEKDAKKEIVEDNTKAENKGKGQEIGKDNDSLKVENESKKIGCGCLFL